MGSARVYVAPSALCFLIGIKPGPMAQAITFCAFGAFQPLFRLHVVRVNRVLISDVKPATCNHWMRPRRQRALLDSESSLLSIRSWISVDQTNYSVFAERVEMSIG